MRLSLLKFGGMVIVAICLGGHITELFDRWEKAAISGNDVDYNCVFVASVVGAVLVISGMLRKLFQALPKPAPVAVVDSHFLVLSAPMAFAPAHSPPLTLQI